MEQSKNTQQLRIAVSRIPFTVWVIVFGASGYFFPIVYTWNWHEWQPKNAIGPLVQLIMFGMGVSLKFDDFARVLKMPKAVLLGIVCQYSIMPLLAFLFATMFRLETEVAAGLVLIGSCPGGVASNVIAYIARANVPLSVTMTACSTLVSPLVTPLAMKLLAGQYVPIEFTLMMFSILKMVLLPVLLGLLANRYAPSMVQRFIGRAVTLGDGGIKFGCVGFGLSGTLFIAFAIGFLQPRSAKIPHGVATCTPQRLDQVNSRVNSVNDFPVFGSDLEIRKYVLIAHFNGKGDVASQLSG